MKVAFVHDLFLGTMGEGNSTTVMMNVKGENVHEKGVWGEIDDKDTVKT